MTGVAVTPDARGLVHVGVDAGGPLVKDALPVDRGVGVAVITDVDSYRLCDGGQVAVAGLVAPAVLLGHAAAHDEACSQQGEKDDP